MTTTKTLTTTSTIAAAAITVTTKRANFQRLRFELGSSDDLPFVYFAETTLIDLGSWQT